VTKLEILWEWLKTCELIEGWLYFNAVRLEENNVSLSMIGNNTIQDYISGSSERELVFSIDFMQLHDLEQSDTNLKSTEEVIGLADWIESAILPDFGESCVVEKVEILEEIPSVLIDQDLNLCKYQFQARVLYLQL